MIAPPNLHRLLLRLTEDMALLSAIQRQNDDPKLNGPLEQLWGPLNEAYVLVEHAREVAARGAA